MKYMTSYSGNTNLNKVDWIIQLEKLNINVRTITTDKENLYSVKGFNLPRQFNNFIFINPKI